MDPFINGGEIIKSNTDTLMSRLFEKEASKDLTVTARSEAQVRCHKLIFEVHSDKLAALLPPTGDESRIEFENNSEEGINRLVKYLYGKELTTHDLSCNVAIELFRTAVQYDLTELQDGLLQLLLQKHQDWYSPDALLQLYFIVRNFTSLGDLQLHLLRLMQCVSYELRSCKTFLAINQSDSIEAINLVWKLFDLVNTTESKLEFRN